MAGRLGKAIYNTPRWRYVRRLAFQRDSYKCRRCERLGGRLEAHHIKALAAGGGAFDLANVETICRACHIAETARANRAQRSPARLGLREMALAQP